MRSALTGCLLLFLFTACNTPKGGNVDWAAYGGGKSNFHYSALSLIDTGNVGKLQKLWEYHTGDGDSMSQIQVNALVIDGVLYGVSPKLKLFALEAATGKSKWVFDPARNANGY